jgi:hypothetical protein
MTQQAYAIESVLNTRHTGKPNQTYLSTVTVLYVDFPNGYHQHILLVSIDTIQP